VRTASERSRAGLQQAGTPDCRLSWRSSVALRVLDRLCAGVIVSDGEGRVVEMNHAARAMVQLGDGLAVRGGRLCAGRVFETARMAKLISVAAAADSTNLAAGRMLIARRGGRPAYLLTVAALHCKQAVDAKPLAILVIVDPQRHSPPESDLAELFGFSPAEARLGVSLMTGKTVTEIAAEFGLRVPTLRTQLRSILKKVGAKRQSDLVRIFANAGIGSVSLAAGWLNLALKALDVPLWVAELLI